MNILVAKLQDWHSYD